MSKPVELIVTNELHRVAEEVDKSPILRAAAETDKGRRDVTEAVARQILCDIAHQANIVYVGKALEAVGITGGVETVRSRFDAVREQRAEERRTLGLPDPAPSENPIDAAVRSFAQKLGEALGPGVSVTPVKAGSED